MERIKPTFEVKEFIFSFLLQEPHGYTNILGFNKSDPLLEKQMSQCTDSLKRIQGLGGK
jgi:hypothetical protein